MPSLSVEEKKATDNTFGIRFWGLGVGIMGRTVPECILDLGLLAKPENKLDRQEG